MNFKQFFGRNKSVFFIGLITLSIFILIIVISIQRSASSNKNKPGMVPVEKNAQDVYEETYHKTQEQPTPEDLSQDTSQSTASENVYPYTRADEAAFDKKYGIMEIKYTQKGWIPRDVNSVLGQLVRWTNSTDKPIYLKQKMPTYDELKEPVLIEPGKTFEFRLYQNRLWTYEEKDSKDFGSIYVLDEIF
jgi:hypothetical protein